ncbi:putative histidine kinase HHK11p [Cucurbitaria berberidis CBS 394.84]|uniref:Histidine kinase HHK11p n=1 Tax=Cucurbitaria berberidis CBS 394.84 TaxID=1168544 RepID=A0A9P4LBY7_9PLEO|nr:putative histidine kinase HHK11p [Cucurbitaria berberidis CBS 394.84]KAF1848827.1 putative histidine kinase HHK11p [Cucurbitaria berberidis CBS 394.84]
MCCVPDPQSHSSEQELAAITLLATLDRDDRPSFAFNVHSAPEHDAPLDIIYHNPALAIVDGLLEKVSRLHDANSIFADVVVGSHVAFRDWLCGRAQNDDLARKGNAYLFEGHVWTAVEVEHYKLVSGVPTALLWVDVVPGRQRGSLNSKESKVPENRPSQSIAPKRLPAAKHGPFDYTLETLPPPAATDPHIAYFRSVDWAQTPLGPMAQWPAELRCIVNLVLNSSFPNVLFWGEEVIMIYNEPYIQFLGALHPGMGKSIRTEAVDHWPSFEPLIKHINETGQSLAEGDMLLFIDRHSFSEETHWSFQFVPVLDSNGYIAGYSQSFFETTDHHLLERRVSGLVEMASQTANARDFHSYWDITLRTMTLNDKDVPFALLYAADRDAGAHMPALSPSYTTTPLEKCLLKGSIGVDANHPIAPSVISIHQSSHIFQPFLVQVVKSKKATIVHLDELASSGAVLEGIDWRGYGDPCRTVVICPILLTTGDQVEGFLILGINPRRPFDQAYQSFVQVMLRLLSTSLASVVLFDDEVRQREIAIGQAARIQEQLLAELKLKEKRFQRFAERSDVGIFIMDRLGKYTYRNKRWYDLFEIAVGDDDVMVAWQKIAFPEDVKYCEGLFAKLVVDHEPICFELKTRMIWSPPADLVQSECESTTNFKWILCSAYPEIDAKGQLCEIVGNVTDISKLKWAESIQKVRTDSALESKQHLEHFIDTTSHEMRNPLSAIMQCADGIISSYSPEDNGQLPRSQTWSTFLEQTMDAAQTIAQCAQHMHHIVDDILTISKLDSGLLVITPVDAQPEAVAKHAIKMFEAEAKAAKVELSFLVDQSFRNMQIDWVSLDPTRLLQVLINLLTNAIKFTRLESTRRVTLSVAASTIEPASVAGGIQFNEDRLVDHDSHLEDDWKQDPDLLFIQFSVIDTGRGLSEEERGSLFTRFSQASPRTHIHYGGSGLGLFISRRLTELQGGAIGLVSEYRKGSTFSFYIKTRRTKPVLARKGSLPSPFPEDIRHRSDPSLISPARPLSSPRKPAVESNLRSDLPSPKVPRQLPYSRQHPMTHEHKSPDTIGVPPEPTLQEVKRPKSTPEIFHVLVVEDNLVNQKVLARQLRNLGCIVSVANHGQEALDFLPKTMCWDHTHPTAPPTYRRSSCHIPSTELIANQEDDTLPIELSLILMDWEMPVMNGLTAVAKIRELERRDVMRGRVPVIGVTANVRQQQIETAIAAGMDDVVSKPFKVAELLARMRTIVASMATETAGQNSKGGSEGTGESRSGSGE